MAVRPNREEGEKGNESEEESEEEGEGAMKTEGVGERVRPEREEGRVKRMIDPRRPTEQEVEDHNRTHLPYRNWCPHCVQARGKDLDHRKSIEERKEDCRSAALTTVSREMNWATC